MAKIIKIDNGIVSIGTDDGKIKEARTVDLSFEPVVGDEVEIFENENTTIVSKKKVAESHNNQGININVSNQNYDRPQATGYYGNAVNKTVYCVLAFFLGWIGVHKFYAGKTGSGVMYLLFSWTGVPAIIAFIEFIVGLCKKADPNGNIIV